MKLILALITVLTSTSLEAQVLKPLSTVRYAGLGCYSTHFSDIFSGTLNQASLSELQTGGFGVYGEKRFLLKELSGFIGVLAIPLKSGTVGFQGDYFGGSSYNESQLGFVYARKVTGKLDIGVKFNYYSVRIAGYGTASALNFEGGIIYHMSDQLCAGLHLYNPFGSTLGGNESEKLPAIYKAGIGYEVSPVVFLSTEVEKEESDRININAGIQYNLHKRAFIRGGITTLTNAGYFAIGIQLGFARVDITTAYHPHLGLTPGLLLLMNFSKQDKD